MPIVAIVLVSFVALLHVYFMVLEMVLWTKPIGLRVFKQTAAAADQTKVLAQNQGLYNGFLAAGLLWSVLAPPALVMPLRIFFLGCVIAAGVFGALTVGRKILFVQAVPAAIALGASLLG
ncbi:MAG: DUF1304 domain-containing protein [Polyangiales bacterium]